MPNGYDAAAALLPEQIRVGLNGADRENAEEFRLRVGRPPTVLSGGTERTLSDRPVSEETLRAVLDVATQSSFHTVADELRRGYISAAGGVRVGVCGTVVTNGGIHTVREISSLAIRIPRQFRSAGKEVIRQAEGTSVLVLSPPGVGKTTFLRELVRTVSDSGVRVGLADERGEIAAACGGIPQFDVGRCTDVLTAAPKAEAAMILLRAMNPQVIALDEISDPADTDAVFRIAGCGVRIFATAHAASTEQLRERRLYRELLDEQLFQKAVVISARGGCRSYRVTAL